MVGGFTYQTKSVEHDKSYLLTVSKNMSIAMQNKNESQIKSVNYAQTSLQ